jgi:hypothetical protein
MTDLNRLRALLANRTFRTLNRPNSPAMPIPMHAPQAMSPTMSAPCSLWTRGWIRYQKSSIIPSNATIKLLHRLDFRIRSPFTRTVYVVGEPVLFRFFGNRRYPASRG